MSEFFLPVDQPPVKQVKQLMQSVDNRGKQSEGGFEAKLDDAIHETMAGDSVEKKSNKHEVEPASVKHFDKGKKNKTEKVKVGKESLEESDDDLSDEIPDGAGLFAGPGVNLMQPGMVTSEQPETNVAGVGLEESDVIPGLIIAGDLLKGELGKSVDTSFVNTAMDASVKYKSETLLNQVISEGSEVTDVAMASGELNSETSTPVDDLSMAEGAKLKADMNMTVKAQEVTTPVLLDSDNNVSDEAVALMKNLPGNEEDDTLDESGQESGNVSAVGKPEKSVFSMGEGSTSGFGSSKGESQFAAEMVNPDAAEESFVMPVSDLASSKSVSSVESLLSGSNVKPEVSSSTTGIASNLNAPNFSIGEPARGSNVEVEAAVSKAGGWQEVEKSLFDSVSNDIGSIKVNGDHKMLLKIHPPELGKLTLEVSLEENVLKVNFKAERVDVAKLLNSGREELIGKFNEMGLDTEQLSVEVETRGDGGKGQEYNESRDYKPAYFGADQPEESDNYSDILPLENVMAASGRISIKA